jgi:hypothetical protein
VATVEDLDGVIERCQSALREFVKGNPKPMQAMFSHREDVTLANPFGPPVRWWEQVAATMEHAASNNQGGRDHRLRDHCQAPHPGARLRRVGGAEQGQARWEGRCGPVRLTGHHNFSP